MLPADGLPPELAKLIASGGKLIGSGEAGPPDPAQMAATFTTVQFRSCYHRFERLLNPEGEIMMYTLIIIDPNDRRHYRYGFDEANRTGMMQALGELGIPPADVEASNE